MLRPPFPKAPLAFLLVVQQLLNMTCRRGAAQCTICSSCGVQPYHEAYQDRLSLYVSTHFLGVESLLQLPLLTHMLPICSWQCEQVSLRSKKRFCEVGQMNVVFSCLQTSSSLVWTSSRSGTVRSIKAALPPLLSFSYLPLL